MACPMNTPVNMAFLLTLTVLFFAPWYADPDSKPEAYKQYQTPQQAYDDLYPKVFNRPGAFSRPVNLQ